MSDINTLMKLYLLHPENTNSEYCFNNSLLTRENWEPFEKYSFDSNRLSEYFNEISDEKRSQFFKFGIDCFLSFVQCNFTGPALNDEVTQILQKESFSKLSHDTILSINNEDVNVNTKHPGLLVIAKIAFKCCTVNNFINNYWYWRSIIIHQQIMDDPTPALLSEADKIYKELDTSVLEGI